jgi:hypothetical protein
MNLLFLLALAIPLSCLALLVSLALLGVLTLGGAIHLMGRCRTLRIPLNWAARAKELSPARPLLSSIPGHRD